MTSLSSKHDSHSSTVDKILYYKDTEFACERKQKVLQILHMWVSQILLTYWYGSKRKKGSVGPSPFWTFHCQIQQHKSPHSYTTHQQRFKTVSRYQNANGNSGCGILLFKNMNWRKRLLRSKRSGFKQIVHTKQQLHKRMTSEHSHLSVHGPSRIIDLSLRDDQEQLHHEIFTYWNEKDNERITTPTTNDPKGNQSCKQSFYTRIRIHVHIHMRI